jgi:ABC-type multidrug transport system fused ATPase/permease subunit
MHRPDLCERFGLVLVMERGRLAEQGKFDDLKRSGATLQKMLGAAV